MANLELSKLEALAKAQAYCARSEHCAADVRRKLYEWQIPSEYADFIEQKLYEEDFLNDARFCRAYVHDKVEYQSWEDLKSKQVLGHLIYRNTKYPQLLIR